MITIKQDITRCNTCVYCDNLTAKCHRYPQTIPIINSHWCGEWALNRSTLAPTANAPEPPKTTVDLTKTTGKKK